MPDQRGFDRLVYFSDAVVAIAATLLILPLVDAAGAIGTMSVGAFLSENGDKLFVFVLSFSVIARFWLGHHGIYKNLIGYNRALMWVNFLWLLSIVFLPLPTELIGSGHASDVATSALYIGTMVVTTIASLVQQWIIIRSPELQVEEARGTLTIVPLVVTTAVMIVALVLAVAVSAIGLWALLLLLLSGLTERVVLRAQRKRVRVSH